MSVTEALSEIQISGAGTARADMKLEVVAIPVSDLERAKELYAGLQVCPAEPRLFLFFEKTESSQRAGRAFLERQARRTTGRDPDASGISTGAQIAAITHWGNVAGGRGATALHHPPRAGGERQARPDDPDDQLVRALPVPGRVLAGE